MSKPNFTFKSIVVCFVAFLCFARVFAQTEVKNPVETSYEIILQTISASKNAGEKTPVPSTLSNVVKKLKDNYPNAGFYLSSTVLQRVALNGNFEFKGVFAAPNQNQDINAPTFSEWRIAQLSSVSDKNGANLIQLRDFRFGQRVPIKTANFNAADGKTTSTVSYEPVGLSMQKINLAENLPTVIGNVSGSTADEMTFLVLTVKPTQN